MDVVEGGKLTDGWRRLFAKYPSRFLVGSDTWVNQRWQDYPSLIGYYRKWLGQRPRDVAEQIAWKNGARLFGLE
jgi:predicted TIM-barrel fold metal-dependent hydrolase